MIASGWPRVALGDICEIRIGRTPSRARPDYWGAGAPWLSIADMRGRRIDTTRESITELAVRECRCRLVDPGTVVLSFKLSVGKVGIAQVPMYTNEAIAALPIRRPELVNRDFLYWALRSKDLTSGMDRAAKGMTLNSTKLRGVRIPMPPWSDQVRIAGMLDRADALRGRRRSSLAMLDTLVESVFIERFGDPAANPMGWPQARLADLGAIVTGNTPSRSVSAYFGGDFEWIKSDNLNGPQHTATRAVEGLTDLGRTVARTVPPGSILVTCIAGSPECIGNAAIVDRHVAFNQQINAIVPRDIDTSFLYVQVLVGKRLIQEASTASMKGMVSKSRFSDIEMMKPPLALQREFNALFASIEAQRSKLAASASQLDALFASLQDAAFAGLL